jgi:adenylate cyclase
LTSERVERRLAAVLAADVAGYSRLMGADEEGTLANLKMLRKSLVDPAISAHRGRIVKTTGDGLLVEFASAVDAARCGVEVQRVMAAQNANVLQEIRIEFRIGIHVGDIIIDDNDIFGDGVNIAARLEGIAEPGGVCISDDTQRQIRGKVDIAFTDMGAQSLKNIAEPMRAWRLHIDQLPSSSPIAPLGPPVNRAQPLALPDRPSIAVLPFQNMSGDPEQEYFADGMVEDITTVLSRIKWLFVIARNSSFTYKGKAVDIKQVGRELGVRYVLEGSVRKAGGRVRITGQLIEAATGAHLWAERYDRDLSDIFALQDEITESVAIAIGPALAEAEKLRAIRKPPDSLDAWEAYHRGLWHFSKQAAAENQLAKPFFQRAIDLDPNFAGGYYGLAMAHFWDGWLYLSAPMPECRELARPLAQRAVALDDADATAHYVLSSLFLSSGDMEGCRTEVERALVLNPNHAWALGGLGAYCSFHGQLPEAMAALDKAMRISPHDPLTWAFMMWGMGGQYFAGEDEAALQSAERLIRFRPDNYIAYRYRAAALGQLGRSEEAKAALKEAFAAAPDNFTFSFYLRNRPPWMRPQDHARLFEGLRKAGYME